MGRPHRLGWPACFFYALVSLIALPGASARAWHDMTHLAVARAAGYERWYNAAGADMAKLKAGGRERYNHYFNNALGVDVTPALVLLQAQRYNAPEGIQGHLYGAVLGSLRRYLRSTEEGKYAEYNLAFCAHYVADLSQPLHNTPWDDFNRRRHTANDATVEDDGLPAITRNIRLHMYDISLRGEDFERAVAREVARIANLSRHLGMRLRAEDRNMTREEAYTQLGHSASLLRAILIRLGKDVHVEESLPAAR
jgi:hypothetical protein